MANSVTVWRVHDGTDKSNGNATGGQFPSNKRLYPRFLIPQDGLSFIELEDGKRASISDISYGGISAQFDDDKFFRQVADALYSQKPIHLKLEMFAKSVSCNMVPVFRDNNSLGLCFRHDSSEELVFLKNIISTLQIGVDLAQQTPIHALVGNSFEYDAINETSLIGEVAIDDSVGSEMNARVIYRDGNIHYSVTTDRGHLSTAQTIGMGAVLTPLTPTTRLDKRILRGALMLLAGSLSIAEQPALEELYDHFAKALLGNRQRMDIAG